MCVVPEYKYGRAVMINVKKFVETEFGTTENLRNELASAKLNPPALDSVQKWERRNSLPGNWLAAALAIRETQLGAPISIIPYIEGDHFECHPSLNAKPAPIGAQPSVFE